MLDRSFAERFAQEWVAAWNAADLERIFSHYADDFEFSSPLIVQRGYSPSGKLKGKDAVRPYWAAGLASTLPLHFEIIEVFAGSDSISIQYRSRGRRVACETFIFDEHRRVVRSMATHALQAE
jgi:hypothetical protein